MPFICIVREARDHYFFEEEFNKLRFTPIYDLVEINNSHGNYVQNIKQVDYRECFTEMKEHKIENTNEKSLKKNLKPKNRNK